MALVEPGTLVVVVDDETDVRQGIADVLAMEGYEVRAFAGADAAWSEIAAGLDPAVIVLDLWLRGMSSGEFVRGLRGSRAAGVAVLVLSGAPSAEHVEADVDAVSRKPMEATSLVRAVDELVRKRGRRAPARAPRRPAGPAAAPVARQRAMD